MNSYYDITESLYSAAGDGSTDDTTAIQSPIDDAAAAGGGIVYIPEGRYKVTATLEIADVDNVVLKGIGNGSVIFTSSSSITVIKIGSTTGDHTDTQYNQVIDLTVDRSVSPDTSSIGINIERAHYVTIQGVNVHNHGRAISVGVPGGSGIPCQWVSILDTHISLSGSSYGSNGFPDAGIKLWQCADIKIHNTFVEPTNVGILMVDNSNGVLTKPMWHSQWQRFQHWY